MTDDANNYEKYESRGADDDSSAVKKATSKSFIDLQHLSSQVYLCDAIIFHVSSTIMPLQAAAAGCWTEVFPNKSCMVSNVLG